MMNWWVTLLIVLGFIAVVITIFFLIWLILFLIAWALDSRDKEKANEYQKRQK